MRFGQRRRRSGRRGAHPRKSKRRMRRAVAMRQPLAHCGRLATEMPCVVDAIDRPAAVVSFQFPESFQIRPRRPPNQTKTLAGRDSRSRAPRRPSLFCVGRDGTRFIDQQKQMYSFAVRNDHRSVTPLDNRVPRQSNPVAPHTLNR
jgi:hypothetical protein